ncbi:MAG: TRAP transporter large permease [Thermodesulfobacteriota bacterium]|nr:TRAP transporter large permease [Thermodesulfobacteriota bacterium]
MTLLLVSSFLISMVINVPIAIALGFAATLAMLTFPTGIPLIILPQTLYSSIDSIILLSVPFFMLAGNLMKTGGVTRRLVRFANALVGGMPGGLGMVAVVACIFFAGMTGSGPAEAAALGILLIPAMAELGYSKGFGAALLASAGSLGIIIPPSIPMVIYSSLTDVSVGTLFLAGFLPGILTGMMLMIINYIISSSRGYRGTKRESVKNALEAFRGAILPLLMPLIIVGGIYGGIFTPTESAVVAVLYAFFLGTFVYKEIGLKDLPGILVDTACTSAVAILIISMASTFGLIATLESLPERIGNFITTIAPNALFFLIFVNIFFFILGCFMSETAAMIIMMPILLPTLTALKINLTHFGILMMLNIAIGMATPPFGVNLFVTCSIAKISIEQYAKEVWPFIIALIISLFLVTYIPEITLFLPKILQR